MDQFLQLPRGERNLYFVQTAERLRLSPQIVEKDFWVCWTLQALFALPGLVLACLAQLPILFGSLPRRIQVALGFFELLLEESDALNQFFRRFFLI